MKNVTLFLLLAISMSACKKSSSPASEASAWTLVAHLNGINMNQNMQDLALSDAKTLWAVGYENFLEKSTDGGVTWQRFIVDPALPDQVLWRCVYFRTPQVGWIIGGNEIYKTTDGGNTWTSVYNSAVSGSMYLPYSVNFLSDSKAFICSLDGTLMRTLDGGVTWENQHLDSFFRLDFNSVSFADDNHGWLVGTNGILYGTTDGGGHWTLLHSGADPALTPFSGYDCRYIIPLSATEIVGVNNGKVIRSADGGNVWTIDGGTTGSSDLLFARNANDWFAGLQGHYNGTTSMSHTTDGGKTWNNFNPAGNINPIIRIVNYGSTVYAVTNAMEILKYNN